MPGSPGLDQQVEDGPIYKWATETLESYAPRVAGLLGLPVLQASIKIDDLDVAASTHGDVITLGRDWFSKNKDVGGLVHEYVHVLTEGSEITEDNQWVVEGIADWVRDELGLPATEHPHIGRRGPLKGYEGSAKFIRWMEKGSPGTSANLAQALVGGYYTPDYIRQLTGVPLRQLAKTYKQGATPERAIRQARPDIYARGIPYPAAAPAARRGPFGEMLYNATSEGLGLPPGSGQGGKGMIGEGVRPGYNPETGGGGGGSGDFNLEDLLDSLGDDKKSDKEKRAARRARRQTNFNQQQSFASMVLGLGIGLTPNLRQLIDEAEHKNYNSDAFMFFLRKTPEYREAFPGIFNKDGSLKMSEADYLNNVAQFEATAAQAGVNLNDKTQAYLFKHNVSPAEFATRAPAIGELKRNPDLWRAFGRELVQGGVAKQGEVTRKSLLRFAAGMRNQAWVDLWQDTVTRNAAIEAGIAIKAHPGKRYAAIGQGMIEKISGKGLSEEQLASGFEQVAEHLLTTLPLSRLQSYNLSKRDIAQSVFGGPKQAEARQKIKRILAQEEAFYEPRVQAGIQASETGGIQTQGRVQRAQA